MRASMRLLLIVLFFIIGLFIAFPHVTSAAPDAAPETQTSSLTAGYYEERAAGITYSGAWNYYQSNGASGGGYMRTNDAKARANFSFTGTRLTLYRTLYTSRGPMDVCIDGACQRIENYSAAVQYAVPVSFDVAEGAHSVEIRNTSTKYIDLDAVLIEGGTTGAPVVQPTSTPLPTAQPQAASGFGVGYYEERAAGITYSGTWNYYSGSGASNGGYLRTNTATGKASFSFTGTRLTVYRTLYTSRGPMDVCIDGACQRIENYSAAVQYAVPVSFDVADGAHAVEIRNTSTKYIDLDAIRIESGTVAALPAPAMVSPDNGAQIAAADQPFVFNWDAVSGATNYHLQIATDSNFTSTVYDNTPSSDGWAAQTPFNAGTYYWRVRAMNGSQGGAWAGTRSFGIASTLLPAPGIVGPANGEQIAYDSQPFVFNWDAVPGATNYHLQVSTASNFSTTVYDNTPSSDGWSAQTPFNAGTYYWRVQAMNGTQGGNWTGTQSVVITTSTVAQPTPTYRVGRPWEHPLATTRMYASSSVWNTPIGSNPAIDRYSSQMVATMGNAVNGGKIYSDTTQYTYPVYFADSSTPRYNIPCVTYKCTQVAADGSVTRVTMLYNVPIPNGAKQSSGTDAQLIVIDVETGREWGLYHAAKQSDGSWKAGNGYLYTQGATGSGTPNPFGSRGAGVTYHAGLIRHWEIRQGRIDHAIAFVYQFTKSGRCVYPATMTDGTTTSTYAIPEGARLQLNPSLTEADFDRWGLSRAGKIVARALQQYGMILIDTGGSSKIIAENLTANTLYGVSWSDSDLQYDKYVIANIPYNQFRVLALPSGYWSGAAANYGRCNR